MDKNTRILPVANCWVKDSAGNRGVVLASMMGADGPNIKVRWTQGANESIVPLCSLSGGFQPGMEVLHKPARKGVKSLGEGIVLKTRTLGERDQVLADFPTTGLQRWLPYETLTWIKGAKHRFLTGDTGPEDSAERFRLKALAHAIETWDENTGSLSRMDIDPLPHQIHLVHHILASGNLNWLIADDVGLGKTIEIGMLLAALKQRGQIRRILLVTPAGLTKQWQEELLHKFGMGEFQIYGEDFLINEARHWKMYDQVIGSIDRFKDERHLETLLRSEPWDLVIFDEAHRLSRRQYGMTYDASQRFQLAAALRPVAESMVLLTATPHQGMQDKFQALLQLLRPERSDEIETLALNPQVLADMVFRNNKADVTDLEGNFIFKGKTTRAIRVNVDESALKFDTSLQKYLRKGYAAGSARGNKGRAIGFVMTVYRKLAASSAVAILGALKRRKERIQNQYQEEMLEFDLDNADDRYAGELEENTVTQAAEFFEGELELLDELIVEAQEVLEKDLKIKLFMDQLVQQVLATNAAEKVLVFTEYRTTQDYIQRFLADKFGANKVALINGSMKHAERRKAINKFEDDGQFLISTEAGGEGINLQRRCHVMVNYDLPWNPMRLVQRIGRLYRYGQEIPVVAFNVSSPGTADEQIIQLMYDRIDQVVSDLSAIGNEFSDRLHDDILGQFADMVDVQNILEEAATTNIDRTSERIDDALDRAKSAVSKQRELFEHAASFNPNEARDELVVTSEHISAFVEGMFACENIEIVEKTHADAIWRIRLPEELIEKLGIRRTRWEVTQDRVLAASRPGTHMLDTDSFLMQYLLEIAKSYGFQGHSAVISNTAFNGNALVTSFLRWQNDSGARQRQEYTAWLVQDEGKVVINPKEFDDWLKRRADTGSILVDKANAKSWFSAVELAAENRLKEIGNRWLHPENHQPIAGGWIATRRES